MLAAKAVKKSVSSERCWDDFHIPICSKRRDIWSAQFPADPPPQYDKRRVRMGHCPALAQMSWIPGPTDGSVQILLNRFVGNTRGLNVRPALGKREGFWDGLVRAGLSGDPVRPGGTSGRTEFTQVGRRAPADQR